MREILSLHIGQAGNQIGFSNWELLCAEHGIDRNGRLKEAKEETDRCFASFFLESHCGQFVPRGLFIDLEPTVINQLKTGSYRGLYHPMQLLHGNDDSSSNFSRAFNTVGRLIFASIENKLRKQIESCDFIQSILFHRSLAGGSGSGLTSMIFEILEDYKKTVRFELPIHPSPHFDSCVVGPYNSILGEHFCMEECDVGLLMDNEALFDISCNVLNVKQPTMTTINRILGQVNSCITASSRFNSDMFNDINAILTNLVPYPRIHFPLVSFAPIGNPVKVDHEKNDITEMTRSVFETNHQLVKCDPGNGKYMACSLVYRGLVNTSQIYSTLSEIKSCKMHRFVDWCPTGFKVGIVDQPPLILPNSFMGETKVNVVMMTNSSSVSSVWQRLAQKFHRLYGKRSFVHWFVGEGLEESEFCEALYNIATLAKDYEEVSVDTKLLQISAEQTIVKETDAGAEYGEAPIPKSEVKDPKNKGNENKNEEQNEENEGTNSSNFNSNCQLFRSVGIENQSEHKLKVGISEEMEILNLNSSVISLNNDILMGSNSSALSFLWNSHSRSPDTNIDSRASSLRIPPLISSENADDSFDKSNICQNILGTSFNNNMENYLDQNSEDEESELLLSLVSKTQIE